MNTAHCTPHVYSTSCTFITSQCTQSKVAWVRTRDCGGIMNILSTSRTCILGFNSTNVCPTKDKFWPWYSLGSPLAERNPSLLVREAKRIKLNGKALGVSWWMEYPWGLRAFRLWPYDLPRHSIHHDTPSPFPNNVPMIYGCQQGNSHRRRWFGLQKSSYSLQDPHFVILIK